MQTQEEKRLKALVCTDVSVCVYLRRLTQTEKKTKTSPASEDLSWSEGWMLSFGATISRLVDGRMINPLTVIWQLLKGEGFPCFTM